MRHVPTMVAAAACVLLVARLPPAAGRKIVDTPESRPSGPINPNPDMSPGPTLPPNATFIYEIGVETKPGQGPNTHTTRPAGVVAGAPTAVPRTNTTVELVTGIVGGAVGIVAIVGLAFLMANKGALKIAQKNTSSPSSGGGSRDDVQLEEEGPRESDRMLPPQDASLFLETQLDDAGQVTPPPPQPPVPSPQENPAAAMAQAPPRTPAEIASLVYEEIAARAANLNPVPTHNLRVSVCLLFPSPLVSTWLRCVVFLF